MRSFDFLATPCRTLTGSATLSARDRSGHKGRYADLSRPLRAEARSQPERSRRTICMSYGLGRQSAGRCDALKSAAVVAWLSGRQTRSTAMAGASRARSRQGSNFCPSRGIRRRRPCSAECPSAGRRPTWEPRRSPLDRGKRIRTRLTAAAPPAPSIGGHGPESPSRTGSESLVRGRLHAGSRCRGRLSRGRRTASWWP